MNPRRARGTPDDRADIYNVFAHALPICLLDALPGDTQEARSYPSAACYARAALCPWMGHHVDRAPPRNHDQGLWLAIFLRGSTAIASEDDGGQLELNLFRS